MFYKTLIISFIFCFTNFIIAENNSGFEFTSEKNSFILPFNSAHNLIIIPLKINDSPQLNFILDTGVKNTILSSSMVARAMDLEGDEIVRVLGLGDAGIIEARKIKDITIHIGDITGKDMEMLLISDNVLPLPEIFGFPVHGIIGYELFKEFPVAINYHNEYITIYRNTNYNIRRNSNIIPLKLDNSKPYIETTITRINDTTLTLPLLVDLGASHSLYLNYKYNFLVKDTTISSYLGRGISGDLSGKKGRIEKLQIGKDIIIENSIVAYPDPGKIWIEKFEIDWTGLIGGKILNRFHLIIDYPSEQLVLRKNKRFNKPFISNVSGLELIAKGKEYQDIIVSYVRPGSPADEAGIKQGDKITRINEKKYGEFNLQKAVNKLSAYPGTSIFIVVSRKHTIEKKVNEKESKKEVITKSHSFTFTLREDI